MLRGSTTLISRAIYLTTPLVFNYNDFELKLTSYNGNFEDNFRIAHSEVVNPFIS